MVTLHDARVPDDAEAEERAWLVVRSAYEGRAPAPHARRVPLRALAAAAAVAALVAAAVTPPGRAVLGSVRKVIGKEHAAAALTRLPAPGRLIVDSPAGPWLVSADGSKRLLGDFTHASWSPHGLYAVATAENELAAVEPASGRVRWSLARPNVRFARWGGSRTDTRIAYLTGNRLHVVAGDGTGDVDPCGAPAAAPVAPAWAPGPQHILAYADTHGRIAVLDVTNCAVAWRATPISGLRTLAWSSDGARLLAVSRTGLTVFGRSSAHPLAARALPRVRAAAFDPRSRRIAVVRARDVLLLDAERLRRPARRLFAGAGAFTDVAWSPDGRWLLIAWAGADQWLFLRPDGVSRVRAVASIAEQFGGGAFPGLAGWCCSS